MFNLIPRRIVFQGLTNLLKCNYKTKMKRIRQNVLSQGDLQPFTANQLYDNPGARKKKQVKGRGIGCKKGKTSGRGHKGQYARSGGKVGPAFEGGQTPIHMRLPKFGCPRSIKNRPGYLNMGKLVQWIDQGRIDISKKIDIQTLLKSRIVSKDKCKYGLKLLTRGVSSDFNYKLDLELTDASQQTIDLIKSKGGSVTCVYRTPLKMKEHIKPNEFKYHLEEPLPSKQKVLKLSRIAQKGADVVFNEPQWVKDLGGLQNIIDEEKRKKEEQQKNFQYPANREPGCGKDKIRKRKTQLWKNIDILPDNLV